MILNIPPTLSQIRGVGALSFIGDGSALASSSKTQVYADGNAGNVTAGVPTGKVIKLAVAGTEVARFGGSGIDLKSPTGGYVAAYINGQDYLGIGYSNAVISAQRFALGRFGIASFSALYPGIACDANNIIHNVASGFYHDFRFANVLKYRFAAALAEMDRISLGGTIGSSTDPGAGGLSLTGNIQFTGAGTASSILTTSWADAANGNLFVNVPTGKYEQHRVAGLGSLSIGRASSVQGDSYWSIGQFASDGTLYSNRPGIYATSSMVLNVPSGNYYSIDVNNVEKYRLSSTLLEAPSVSLGGTIGSSTDPGAGGLGLTGNIQFTGTGTASSVLTTAWADASAGNLFSNVPTGKYEQHRVNGVGLLSLGRVSSTISNVGWAIGYFASDGALQAAANGIYGAAAGIVYNVPTSTSHTFWFNNVEKYRLSSTLLEAPSLSLGGTVGSSVDGGAGSLALTNRIQFTGAGTADATKSIIYASAADGSISITVPSAQFMRGVVGGSQKWYADSTGFGVNGNSIMVTTSQSPASNGTGTAGQIAWDANYIYVCTATNTWKRAALTGGY